MRWDMAGGAGETMKTPAILLLAVLLGTGACGEAPDADVLETVRLDSAGVEVVHNRGTGIRWLDMEEVLRVGEIEGAEEYMFDRIRSVARHPDGRIAVLDRAQVRIYDGEGSFLVAMGGQGEGPGEFTFPSQLWWAGDRIRVVDAVDASIVTFEEDGTVVSDVRLEVEPRDRPEMIVPVGERTLALGIRYGDGSRDGRRVAHLGDLFEVDPATGEVSDRLLTLTVGTGFPTDYGETTAPVFDTITRPAVLGPDRIARSSGLGYEIEILDMDGRLVRRVTRGFTPVELGSEADEYWARSVDFRYGDNPAAQDEIAGILARGPELPTVPPVRHILPGRADDFWVVRQDLYAAPAEQAIGPASDEFEEEGYVLEYFDAEGAYVGTVQLPPGVAPSWMSPDLLVGRARDELGVNYLVAYRIGG